MNYCPLIRNQNTVIYRQYILLYTLYSNAWLVHSIFHCMYTLTCKSSNVYSVLMVMHALRKKFHSFFEFATNANAVEPSLHYLHLIIIKSIAYSKASDEIDMFCIPLVTSDI